MFDDHTISDGDPSVEANEFTDYPISCIDCSETFIFTAGEQSFYRDKGLQNQPKRCKDCKKAKTKRIDAIELGRKLGHRQRIDVRAKCAKCEVVTTVPFYPSQGRPVYCRDCYSSMSEGRSSGASNGA